MPTKKKKAEEVEAEVATEAEEAAPKKGNKKNEATVTWQGGVRTYTREIHGDDFAAYAEEFAAKKGGTVA